MSFALKLASMNEDNKHIIEEWWTKSQINLVKDSFRIWIKKAFKSTSGFWTQPTGAKLPSKTSQHDVIPEDAIIENTAWNHEHCELCFETISDHGDFQREGYTDNKAWLCIDCFNKYISSQQIA
jgi:hypothetical protein